MTRPDDSANALPALTFHFGAPGALTPFAVFLGGVTALALSGAPDERGFWPVLLGALITGLLLAKDRARYAEAMLDGMSQRIVMIMLCAWLFAGVLGTLLAASGFVSALAWTAQSLSLSGGGYVAAAFLACALISTATGTSFGTILVAGPLLYPAGGAAGAAPAVLMGAILAGSTFGDSISPVSDTTIASSGTQDADIGTTVRRRMKYAVPAGLAALVVSALLGSGGTAVATANAGAATTAGRPLPLVMLVVPVLVIGLLLAKRHLIEALLFGIVAAAGTGLAAGLIPPGALLRVESGALGASGLIVDGLQRAVGVSVFTLLLMALVGTIQATDLLERLVRAAEGRAKSARGAEWWIVGVVSGAVLLTTHSVVAVLVTGPFAKETGARFGLSRYRRANLLDLTVCTWPFLFPWFLPPILAASTTKAAESFGMPALAPATIGLHNTYAWALVVVVAVAVITGYGRESEPSSNRSIPVLPLLAAALATLSAIAITPVQARAQDSPAGTWHTISDVDGRPRGIITLRVANGVLTGTIAGTLVPGEQPGKLCDRCTDERRGKPLLGMEILRGLRWNGASWTGGEILDPDTGKTYRATIRLSEDGRALALRGYIGISLLGRTQRWVRAE